MSALFRQIVPLERITSQPQPYSLAASADARAGLSERFDLGSIEALTARLSLVREGQGARLTGRFEADFHYLCRVSREPFPARIAGPVDILYLPEADLPAADDPGVGDLDHDLDVLEAGGVDIAEAVAASLALELDPYPRSPDADAARQALGIRTEEEDRLSRSPFAMLRDGKEKA